MAKLQSVCEVPARVCLRGPSPGLSARSQLESVCEVPAGGVLGIAFFSRDKERNVSYLNSPGLAHTLMIHGAA